MMNPNRGFDEVMIVNPNDPRVHAREGVKLMQYSYGEPPEMGYYAEPPDMGYYGQPPGMGYYGEPPDMGYYGQPPGMGYYAEPPEMGYYGQSPMMGYYGEQEPVGYFAEESPLGYYGQYPGMAAYAEHPTMGYYGAMPEMVGYGEDPLAEADPNMGYYGEPEMSGYVRDASPAFNAGCPLPTNVAGYGESDPYGEAEQMAGYTRPTDVSPSCGQFSLQPGPRSSVPETFKPLW
jgi:hypothetical protein